MTRTQRPKIAAVVALVCSLAATPVEGFLLPAPPAARSAGTGASTAKQQSNDDVDGTAPSSVPLNRRGVLEKVALAGGLLSTATAAATPAQAKVEGYAPPKKALPEEYRQGTVALSDSEDDAPIPRESYKKLPSGLVYADIREGKGDAAAAAEVGSRCNIQWVLRRGNGYFVDSSDVSGGVPFIFTVGDGTAIRGVDEGVRGMKAGGSRRLLIPVGLAYVDGLDDGKPGPLPAGFGPRQQMRRVQSIRKDVPGEYIFLEVQLTRVR